MPSLSCMMAEAVARGAAQTVSEWRIYYYHDHYVITHAHALSHSLSLSLSVLAAKESSSYYLFIYLFFSLLIIPFLSFFFCSSGQTRSHVSAETIRQYWCARGIPVTATSETPLAEPREAGWWFAWSPRKPTWKTSTFEYTVRV